MPIRKRSYDMAFIANIIPYVEKRSNSGGPRKFGGDENRVRDPRQAKDLIHKTSLKRKELDGEGRKQI